MSNKRDVLHLLHLSDLHFSAADRTGHYWNSDPAVLERPQEDRRTLLESLVGDLATIAVKPSAIAVTGDLVDKGQASQVATALAFLTGLIRAFDLEPSCVALVPGNHDWDLNEPPARRGVLFCEVWNQFYGASKPKLDPASEPWEWVSTFPIGDGRCLLVGLNSCEDSEPVAGTHGSISRKQRDKATQLLTPYGRDGIRIALMHHHVHPPQGTARSDLSVMRDPGSLKKWLVENRIPIVLHGHQHVAWQDAVMVEGHDDYKLVVTAGGSIGVGKYGRDKWELPLSYQVLKVEPQKLRLIRRQYDVRTQEWTGAAGSPPKALPFGRLSAGKGQVTSTAGVVSRHDSQELQPPPAIAKHPQSSRPAPPEPSIRVFHDEGALLEAVLAVIGKARVGIDVWMHTARHSSENTRAQSLNEALRCARTRCVPVRVVAVNDTALAGAHELSCTNDVRIRFAERPAQAEFRYLSVDAETVCLGISSPTAGPYRVPFSNMVLVKSRKVAELFARDFTEVWFSPEAKSLQEVLVEKMVGGASPADLATDQCPEDYIQDLLGRSKQMGFVRSHTVIFYGMASSGKSTLMARLAGRLPLRFFDLADVVNPLLGKMRVDHIEAREVHQIYEALRDHLSRSSAYGMIEIAPDIAPLDLTAICNSISAQGRSIAVVGLEARSEVIAERNGKRARAIGVDVLKAQQEGARERPIESFCRMIGVPFKSVSTDGVAVETSVEQVEAFLAGL